MHLSFEVVTGLYVIVVSVLLIAMTIRIHFQSFLFSHQRRKMDRLEKEFQRKLIQDLRVRFPGCWIMKNDEQYRQGTPDICILFNTEWAMLECKRSEPTRASDYEPNQEHYLRELNNMSFASVIYPQNRERVLRDLEYHFGVA